MDRVGMQDVKGVWRKFGLQAQTSQARHNILAFYMSLLLWFDTFWWYCVVLDACVCLMKSSSSTIGASMWSSNGFLTYLHVRFLWERERDAERFGEERFWNEGLWDSEGRMIGVSNWWILWSSWLMSEACNL